MKLQNKKPSKYLRSRIIPWIIVILIGIAMEYFVITYFNSPKTYTTTKIEAKTNKLLTRLEIIRKEDKIDNLPYLKQEITDQAVIKKLYDQIYALPEFGPGTYNCPAGFYSRYNMKFYSYDTVVLRGTLNPTSCPQIVLGSGVIKWALDYKKINFSDSLQKAMSLSNRDFYGAQNGKPLR